MRGWKRNEDVSWIEYENETGVRIVRTDSQPFYTAHYPNGGFQWFIGRSAKEAAKTAMEICQPYMLEY